MTNSFNYLRAPDVDAQYDRNAQLQQNQVGSMSKQSIKEAVTKVKNDQNKESVSDIFNALAPFSEGIGKLAGVGHKIKTDLADAQVKLDNAVRTDKSPEEQQLEVKESEIESDSKLINKVANDLEKEDGPESLPVEELRQRDPYYRAAQRKYEINEVVENAAFNLEERKADLTITDEEGNELTYDSITKGSDMAAWLKKFKAEYILNNMKDITAGAYARHADKPLTTLLQNTANSWNTENVRKQKAERLEQVGQSIAIAARGSGEKLTDVVIQEIQSGRASTKQVAGILLTLAQGQEISDEEFDSLTDLSRTFKKNGKDTSVSEQFALYMPAIKKARLTAESSKFDNYVKAKRNAEIQNQSFLEQSAYEDLQNGGDGTLSDSFLEQADDKFFEANGFRSETIRKWRENKSTEVVESKEQLKDIRERIALGTFDKKELHFLSPSIKQTVQGLLNNSPNYAADNALHKVNLKTLETMVKGGLRASIHGERHYSVHPMIDKIKSQYLSELKRNPAMTPEDARRKVEEQFLRDLNKEGFRNANGYLEFITNPGESLEATKRRNAKFNTIKDTINAVGAKSALESPGLFYSQNELQSKVNMMEAGGNSFTSADMLLAQLAGAAHPRLLIRDLAEKQGIKMDLPPIYEVAQDIFTGAHAQAITNAGTVNTVKRAFAALTQTRGLPVRSVFGGGQVPESDTTALQEVAAELGVDAIDLATIIGFETGGTYEPEQVGGEGDNYRGLIQFGGPEREAYGVTPGMTFEEQLRGPVLNYFKDRFAKAGMSTQGASLEDLYTTVIAGNPGANRNAQDSNGTSAISGVAKMGPHREAAIKRYGL